MSITARHLAKRAPSLRYSMSRSRRPSSPSVIVSPGKPARGLAPRSTLMPGIMPVLGEVLRKRRAVLSSLADGLVVEDHAAHRLGSPGGGEQHLPVGAAMLLGRLQLDAVEALLDGAAALVGGQDAFALGDHRAGDALELAEIHRPLLERPTCVLLKTVRRSRDRKPLKIGWPRIAKTAPPDLVHETN